MNLLPLFAGHLRNPVRRLRCDLVRGLRFEAVRDGLEHGQAAAARRLPLLHALRSFRPDHNFLEKKKNWISLYHWILVFLVEFVMTRNKKKNMNTFERKLKELIWSLANDYLFL